jgi:hypothetical protein
MSGVELAHLLRKLAAFLMAAALIGLALVFSVLALSIILTAGAIAWAYFWWKTRELRNRMRQHFADGRPFDGSAMHAEIFEGEIVGGRVLEGEVVQRVEPESPSSPREPYADSDASHPSMAEIRRINRENE